MFLAKKSLGQHFLIDQEIITKIIKVSGNIKNYNILEIGPGNGALTHALLLKQPLTLISIEKDKHFFAQHLQLMQSFSNYKCIIDDVLNINLNDVISNPKKIIANIPYNISNELFKKFLQTDLRSFVSLTLMVQKEFAIKIMQSSKLGFLMQMQTDIDYMFEVDKKCFFPQPKVQSAVILITPKQKYIDVVHVANMKKLIEVFFNHKRKVIRTSMKKFFSDPIDVLNSLNIDNNIRVDGLSLEQLSKIAYKILD